MASQSQRMIQDDRTFIYDTGGRLRDRSRSNADNMEERAGFYQTAGDEHYIPLLEGRGGYSESEQADIMGRDRLDRMQLSPEDQQSAYLTPEEQAGIRGNEWNRAQFYDPSTEMTNLYRREDMGRQGVDRFDREINSSFDPSKLSMSDRYGSDIDTAINDGGSRVRSAIDPTKMRLSDDFISRYRMTPEAQQRYLSSVARDSTAVSQSEMARNAEAARAAGIDPLGTASYLERANRKSRQDVNRALADARVNAESVAAGREKDIEGMRLGAEQGYSGAATNTELALQGRALGAAQNREDTRLGAERDVAGRRGDAVTKAGQARLGFEDTATQRDTQQRQFNTDRGLQVAGDMENQRTGAATTIATNRQGVNQQNRGDVYDRQQYADQQIAGRTGAVADARRGDQREARQWVTDQQNNRLNIGQQERNREAGLYGTQAGAAIGTTQAQQTQDNQPKWWEKALGAAGGVMGGLGSMGLKI